LGKELDNCDAVKKHSFIHVGFGAIFRLSFFCFLKYFSYWVWTNFRVILLFFMKYLCGGSLKEKRENDAEDHTLQKRLVGFYI
jgi:hypothetical protein